MKRAIRGLSFLLLLATGACVGEQAKTTTWFDNYPAAQAMAKKTNRPILVCFTGSDWCPWCVKMEQEIFSQPAFLDYARTNLILFVADFPEQKKLPDKIAKQNEDLLAKYNKEGYFPVVLLLDADGKALAQTGYQPGGADPFVTALKGALADIRRNSPVVATNQMKKATAPLVKR